MFRIKTAGLVVEIRCVHEELKHRCSGYLYPDAERCTLPEEAQADIVIETKPEEFQMQQRMLDETARLEGRPAQIRSDRHLEWLQIHSLLARKMLDHGVLLMHGSALAVDGQAFIFTAPSGTGKSTHSKLWRELLGDKVTMINDDKPFLKVTEENGRCSVYVCGSPWDGAHHLSENIMVPVKAIVSLARDTENHISRMDKNEAYPILYRQTLREREPAAMVKIMALQQKIIQSTEWYGMGCNMDPEAARIAFETLTK